MRTWKIVVISAIATTVFFAVLGSTVYKDEPVKPTQQANDTTLRNSFISGCTGEGVDSVTCACAFNKLVQLYPDFTTNKVRLDRITTEGYNQTETDAVVPCVTHPQTLTD